MKLFKTLFILTTACILAACSSAPSDSDVQAVSNQASAQAFRQFEALGLKMSDVLTIDVKVKNKAKQDDGRWLVEAETTMTAKKDMKELSADAQMVIASLFGDIKKGQPVGGGAVSGKFYMQKGDKGWMATN